LLVAAHAAPVSLTDEAATRRQASGQSVNMPSAEGTPKTSMSVLDWSMMPAASTGVGELDLLLSAPGLTSQPDAAAQHAAPISAAAASAAAAELSALRARAAQMARSPEAAAQADQALLERQSLPVQRQGEIGTWQGDRRAAEPEPSKMWPGAAEGVAAQPAMREPWREGGARPAQLGEEHPLLRIPRETLEFLRDNRFELLGLVGVIAVLAALLKVYSRRI